MSRKQLAMTSVVAMTVVVVAIIIWRSRTNAVGDEPKRFAKRERPEVKYEWPEKPATPAPPFVLAKDLNNANLNANAAAKPFEKVVREKNVKLAEAGVPTLAPTKLLGDFQRVGPCVHSSLALSADGSHAAFVGNAISFGNAWFPTYLVLWDVKAGQPLRQMRLPSIHVNVQFPVVLSPDGKTLFQSYPFDRMGGGPLRAWDTATGTLLFERATNLWALSADGKTIATVDIHVGTFDNISNAPYRPWHSTLTFWNRDDLRPRASYKYMELVPNCLALAPDGSTAVVGLAGEAIALDSATGKVRWREMAVSEPYWSYPVLFAFSPDGRTIAAANPRRDLKSTNIYLLDTATGKKRTLFSRKGEGFSGQIDYGMMRLSFTPDGKTLYAGSNGWVLPIDVATGELPPPRESPKYLGDLRRRGVSAADDALLHTFALSADGRVMLIGGMYRADACDLRHFDPAKQKTVFPPPVVLVKAPSPPVDPYPATWDMRLEIYPRETKLSRGASLEWSSSWDEPIWYRTERGKQLIAERLHGYIATPDGETLLTRGQHGKEKINKRHVALHDLATGKEWAAIAGPAGYPGGGWREMAMSADGRTLALKNSADDSIWLWEIATARPRLRLASAGNQAIFSFTFSRDGKSLFANDLHGQTGLVWDFAAAFPGTPEARDLDGLWKDLTGDDASRAFGAMCRLSRAPDLAIPYLAAKASKDVLTESLQTRPFAPQVVRARRIVETLERTGGREALVALEKLASSKSPHLAGPASAAVDRLRLVSKELGKQTER